MLRGHSVTNKPTDRKPEFSQRKMRQTLNAAKKLVRKLQQVFVHVRRGSAGGVKVKMLSIFLTHVRRGVLAERTNLKRAPPSNESKQTLFFDPNC